MNAQDLKVVYVIVRILLYLATHPLLTARIVAYVTKWWWNQGDFADFDFYNITTGQISHRFFGKKVGGKYVVINRSKKPIPAGFVDEFRDWVKKYAKRNHNMSRSTVAYLSTIPYLDQSFLNYLADTSHHILRAEDVHVEDNGEIWVEGVETDVAFWEVPILTHWSRQMAKLSGEKVLSLRWLARTWDKVTTLKREGLTVSEFGARRRQSYLSQLLVLLIILASGSLKKPGDKGGFLGTSNIHFGEMLGLKLMGTMNHAKFMMMGGLFGYDKANAYWVKLWRNGFGSNVGYWLTDTKTSRRFLEDVDPDDVLAATGLRQDSYDPYSFVDDAVAYYKRMGLSEEQIRKISIVFSDSLNVEKALDIARYCEKAGIGCSFGIGTFLTNDVDGIKAPNVAFKIIEVFLMNNPDDRRACVKISDNPYDPNNLGKISGALTVVRQIIHWLKTGEKTWIKPLLDEEYFEDLLLAS